MAKEKKSQEDKEYEADCAEMERFELSRYPDENIYTWRLRMSHEDKMKLMYSMAVMLENNPEAVPVWQHVVGRFEHLKKLHDEGNYE